MRYPSPRTAALVSCLAWTLLAFVAVAAPAQDSSATDAPSAGAVQEPSALSRGKSALEAGRTEEALLEFRQAVEDQPESVDARLGLARSLALLRRGSEALEHYRHAAEIDPHLALPRVGMADILFAQGELDEALGHFRAGVDLDPTSERARLGEAQVLNALGRHEEVLESLEEAHKALPASGLAAYGLAWTLAASPDPSLRDGERALSLAEAVFESHQSLPNAELVAEALAELDRCQKAADWMRGIDETVIQPGAPPAIAERLQRNIERFEQGPPCRAPVATSDASDL